MLSQDLSAMEGATFLPAFLLQAYWASISKDKNKEHDLLAFKCKMLYWFIDNSNKGNKKDVSDLLHDLPVIAISCKVTDEKSSQSALRRAAKEKGKWNELYQV